MTNLRSPFAADFTADDAAALAGHLKALACPQWLRILAQLNTFGVMANRDLEHDLGIPQPTMAHHLQILDAAGLIRSRRAGVFVERELNADALADLAQLLTPEGAR